MGFLSDYGTELKIDHFIKSSVMRNTHIHPQYELYFCSEPIGQISVINGVKYTYKYPCAILSTPYTVHSMSCCDDSETYDRYVFYFGQNVIDDFNDDILPKHIFAGNTGLFFKLTAEEAKNMKKIVEICNENSSTAENELMLALLLNRLVAVCNGERIEKIGKESFYIQNVLQYIAEHFADDLNIDSISRYFAVSRSKLDRDFKKFTGKTVHDYIELCRLNQAKYMLDHKNDMAISEIANACGFKNDSYFFSFFKRIEKLTPTEYKKAKINNKE